MKKLIFVLFVLLTNVSFIRAQNQKATVYLLRSAGPDEVVPYFTYMDNILLCKLGDGKYSVHEAEPGQHKFHTQYKGKIKSNPETDLMVTLEPGKTYYISVNLTTRAFAKGSFYCEQLSEEEGKKRVTALLLSKKCL